MNYLDLFALTFMPVKRGYVFTKSEWRAYLAGFYHSSFYHEDRSNYYV